MVWIRTTVALLLLPLWASAQTPAPPIIPCALDATRPASKDCPAAPAKAPTQQFPFPGDKPETPAKAAPDTFPYPGEKPAADPAKPQESFPYPGEKPAIKSTPKDGGAAAGAFPYPGETKNSPDAVPETPDFKPAPGSDPLPPRSDPGGSSSSSSGGTPPPDPDDSADKPGLKDEGTTGSTRSTRRRLRPPAQKILSDDERVEEDLTVSHYYTQTGNLQGAYLRAKDAVKIEPNESDAHIALAAIADKMNKKDEAVAEYTAYLKLDPDGEKSKDAKRALDRLKH